MIAVRLQLPPQQQSFIWDLPASILSSDVRFLLPPILHAVFSILLLGWLCSSIIMGCTTEYQLYINREESCWLCNHQHNSHLHCHICLTCVSRTKPRLFFPTIYEGASRESHSVSGCLGVRTVQLFFLPFLWCILFCIDQSVDIRYWIHKMVFEAKGFHGSKRDFH